MRQPPKSKPFGPFVYEQEIPLAFVVIVFCANCDANVLNMYPDGKFETPPDYLSECGHCHEMACFFSSPILATSN